VSFTGYPVKLTLPVRSFMPEARVSYRRWDGWDDDAHAVGVRDVGGACEAGGVADEDSRAAERRARFEALAPELVEPLRRFLARRTDPATADDVLGETLLVCWRRLDDVPADAALPWAYGVARNCLANAQRSARRQGRLAARVATVDPPAETSPGPGDGEGHQGDDRLHEVLARLSDTEAELVRLWAWEQLTPAEIASVLDLTPNAVSIRLHRAREKLKELLRKDRPGAGHEESKEGRTP
jgi:RNA polymerase sigma-70 factor (ECF subfamily)